MNFFCVSEVVANVTTSVISLCFVEQVSKNKHFNCIPVFFPTYDLKDEVMSGFF
jgi:hypothetical protein